MTFKNKSHKKAFTLIELLIVIAIIGILFIVLVSKVDFATDKAKATGVQTDFRSFQVAIETVAKENAGLATFGWDTCDTNGDRIRNSYDKGDTNQNGKQDPGEVFVGSKTYGETWTNIYTLTNPSDANDMSAITALEAAINKNLDPKLHITIHDDYTITMANGAQDPWNTEYHGYYITNSEVDNKDRGAIIIYSNGANQEFGSEHSITNGVVTVNVPGNNKLGKDDYSIAVVYTYVNGYGEVKTSTSGFSNNQGNQGNNAGGSGYNDPEGTLRDETITNISELVTPNIGSGINDYSWSQIQLLSRAKLTADEYKTLYGIELGQMVDDKYLLVDFYDYGGFVFMLNYDYHVDTTQATYKVPAGGYVNSKIISTIENTYNNLPTDIKNVIRKVSIKYTLANDYETLNEYDCRLFLPSAKELCQKGFVDESLNTAFNQEGPAFDYFVSNTELKLQSIYTSDSSQRILTRSAGGSNFFLVEAQPSNGVCVTDYLYCPCFVVGYNGVENQVTDKTNDCLPEENPNKTLNDYTWSELKLLAAANLTAAEYKSKYGIELGQRKYNHYILVDFDNYNGFVFIDANNETSTMDTHKKINGYGDTELSDVVNQRYTTYEFALQRAIKKVPVNFYNNSSLQTEYYYCFIPSLSEIGYDTSKFTAAQNDKFSAEGEIFEYLKTTNGRNEIVFEYGYTLWEWDFYWTRTMSEYSTSSYSSFYTFSIDQSLDDKYQSNATNALYYPRTFNYVIAFVVGGDCTANHYDNDYDLLCDSCYKYMCQVGYGHKDNDLNGLCDMCGFADCSNGIHPTYSEFSWTCKACNKPLCSLGYEHQDLNASGECSGCDTPMCNLGYEHSNDGDWCCIYCNLPLCELGYSHNDVKSEESNTSDGYCDGCNIVWCEYGDCHDLTGDSLCDWCGEVAVCEHSDGYWDDWYDEWRDRDGLCDNCGYDILANCEHIDGYYDDWYEEWYGRDGICDGCGWRMIDVCSHKDGDFYDGYFDQFDEFDTWSRSPMSIMNADGYCDICQAHMCNLGFYGFDYDGDVCCDGCGEPLCVNSWESIYDEYYPHNNSFGWLCYDSPVNEWDYESPGDGYCDGCCKPMCEIMPGTYHCNDGYMMWDDYGYCTWYDPDDGYCDYCGMQIQCANYYWESTYPCYDLVNPETGYTDGICDSCGNYICVNHYDTDGDGYCNDNCMGYNAPPCPDHFDYDGDGYCDWCWLWAESSSGYNPCYDHYDYDGDLYCDSCWGEATSGVWCGHHCDYDGDWFCEECGYDAYW